MAYKEKDNVILAKRQVSEKIINKRFGNYLFLCKWVKEDGYSDAIYKQGERIGNPLNRDYYSTKIKED